MVPTPKVSVAIQHHPSRARFIPRLQEELAPLSVQVVEDPDPESVQASPWRTYRRCLETTPAWATHRMILQDDTLVCRSFAAAVRALVRARPDRPLVLYVGGNALKNQQRYRAACAADIPLVEIDPSTWIPAVCIVWPVELIPRMLRVADEADWPIAWTADDEILGRIVRDLDVVPLATVPSLVEHPDTEESLMFRRPMYGRDPGRIAECFIHPDCDPLEIDWRIDPLTL